MRCDTMEVNSRKRFGIFISASHTMLFGCHNYADFDSDSDTDCLPCVHHFDVVVKFVERPTESFTRDLSMCAHIFLRALYATLWNWPLQLKRNIHKEAHRIFFVGHWARCECFGSFFCLSLMNLVDGRMDFRSSFLVVVILVLVKFFFLLPEQCICVSTYFVLEFIIIWIQHFLNCRVSARTHKRERER